MSLKKKLLNKKRGKESVNENEIIPIKLDRDISFFHDEILTDTVDTMEVYNNEKNNSTKHRFIFTLYPLFTNILFNKLTEVVYKEGSEDAKALDETDDISNKIKSDFWPISTSNINRKQSIRNTEYSDERYNLTYHCGVDIFNNHLLRSKENISVQKRPHDAENVMKKCRLYYGDSDKYDEIDSFNTIGDYNRTFNGYNDIKLNLPNENLLYDYDTDNIKSSPLYLYDTINTFNDSFYNNIMRKDGWIGLLNKTTLKTPIWADGEYYVNKLLNNKQDYEFIDMCPERDLFYFSPKINKDRKRLEYNWYYCLTYPYKSIYNDGYILNGKENGLPLSKFNNDKYLIEYNNDNGFPLVIFRSPVRHNLNKGDYINLKFYNGDNVNNIKCNVVSVGDFNNNNIDRYFSVRKSDFEDYVTENDIPKRFSKIVNGFECEYYFRKFKKLNGEYNSSINNLAFAKTIYGDEVSQIVYTDDINIIDYKDNRGRPLSELFLTIIKKNKGHELWYENNEYNDSEIEYSHVFGKLTSGLDLPYYADIKLPIIRRQHNINDGSDITFNNGNVKIEKSSSKMENDITENFNEFYGDLVEFNPITQDETVIEDIFYRFNTAQRETSNPKYKKLYYDEIRMDIYDTGYGEKTRINEYILNEGYANLAPEGYIYKPHFKIKLREINENINQESHGHMDVYDIKDEKNIFIKTEKKFLVNDKVFIFNYGNMDKKYEIIITKVKKNGSEYEYNGEFVNKDGYPNENMLLYLIIPGESPFLIKEWNLLNGMNITFNTITNYSLDVNNIVILTDKSNIYKYRVKSYLMKNEKYECNIVIDDNDNPSNLSECVYFKYNISIPEYSYILPDNSGRALWKNIKLPSEYVFMDELYKIPFTNGAFYHHVNINFFVKRQDPFREYGMIVNGGESDTEIPSTEFDKSMDEYKVKNDSICF